MASVLVVREYDEFSRILEARGFDVVNCPAIRTVRVVDKIELGAQLDGVFISSRAAAGILARSGGVSGAVYVFGRKSFDILKDRGFDLRFVESANSAAELLAAIPRSEIEGKRFAFVRGEESLRVIPDGLCPMRSSTATTPAQRSTRSLFTGPNVSRSRRRSARAISTGSVFSVRARLRVSSIRPATAN